MSRLRVTVDDCRACGYCVTGMRDWFRKHGFDWRQFLAEGIDAEVMLSTGCVLVEDCVKQAKRRTESE